MGKVLEKQTKTIEEQGNKQIKVIQDKDFNKSIEETKVYSDSDYKKELLLSKEREIFKDIYNKRLDEIEDVNNKIDYDNLKYVVESSSYEYRFNKIEDPIALLENIKKGKISLKEAKSQQQNYNNYLNTIRRGNKNDTQKRKTFFLMQEIVQLNLSKIMFQSFLRQREKEWDLK